MEGGLAIAGGERVRVRRHSPSALADKFRIPWLSVEEPQAMPVALDPTTRSRRSRVLPELLCAALFGSRAHAALAITLENFLPDHGNVFPTHRAVVRAGTLKVDGLRPKLPVHLGLWPAPRTYTGQDVAEIHLAGATPLVSLVLAHCLGRGARHAEPGEFTLRASFPAAST